MVKSFDYSKSAIFQQIIEEAIEKVEQEEIAKQELDRNDGIKDTTKSIFEDRLKFLEEEVRNSTLSSNKKYNTSEKLKRIKII